MSNYKPLPLKMGWKGCWQFRWSLPTTLRWICLRRAILPEQTFERHQQNPKHAAKLLGIYTRQMEALDQHRGKSQQKITNGPVTVEAGGQAFLGNFETGPPAERAAPPPAQALEHNPDVSVPFGHASPSPKELVPIPARAKGTGRKGN